MLIFINATGTAVYILNLYWFGLILKGIKRMLQEAGVLEKSNKKEFDELSKYETEIELKKDWKQITYIKFLKKVAF